MRLSEVLAGYWLEKRLDLSPNTARDYRLHFTRLLAFLEDVGFTSITPDDIRRFLAHVQAEHHLGKKTLANTWIALSSLWSWAEREYGYTHVIRGRVKRPRYQSREIDPLEPAEITAMLDAADYTKEYTTRGGNTARNKRPTALRDVAILLTLLDSGLRASELCALQVRDYDKLRGRLHVRSGKGGKERFVPLGVRSQQAIQQYVASRKTKPMDPLFATKTGNHLERNNLGNLLTAIAQAAGVHVAHPHRWRHTFAISFLRAGGNTLLLQALLGHSSLEMVAKYARIAERDVNGAGKFSPADNMQF